jgi:hypothetical protein
MRRDRWMTAKERDAMREGIAKAGSVGAWIREAASADARAAQRERMRRMNALAKRIGHAVPYPALEEDTR